MHDIRSVSEMPLFDESGFCVDFLDSELTSTEFYQTEKVESTYYPELQALLLQRFNASRVEILEHRVSLIQYHTLKYQLCLLKYL